MAESAGIALKKEGSVGIITMQRPEVYNALNRAAKLELIQAIRNHNKDPEVRCIVLTGEGKAFSTGQDLNDRTVQAGEGAIDLGYTLETEWNPLVQAIRQSPKIVIAAVNGVCAGAGLNVALACDLIVCKPATKFVSGFVKLGLAPDAGSTYTFVRQLGPQRTLEFFVFNEPLTAEELYQYGMVNRVSDDYWEVAMKMADSLAAMAPLALQMVKSNIQSAREQDFKASMQKETATQRMLGNSQDYQEGLKAFFEKRPAHFKGR